MRYDLHIHTRNSRCSNLNPLDILKIAKEKGLDGIAVTDHNSIRGGMEAAELNKDRNFEVIVGSEIKTNKGEVLGYYLKEDIKSRDFFDVISEIHSQGGIAVVAHPFAFGIARKKLGFDLKEIKDMVDGIEGFNGRYFLKRKNAMALAAAQEHNIAVTAGSDAHFGFEVGSCFTVFEGDLKTALKLRKTGVFGTTRHAFSGSVMTALERIKKLFKD
jgi:hypothetical protein